MEARTLKGWYGLMFLDENKMTPVGKPLSATFRNEGPEGTAKAHQAFQAGLAAMAGKGRFGTEYNPGAKPGQDVMAVYTYHARYEDNGQVETPLVVITKADLDSVEMAELRELFESL